MKKKLEQNEAETFAEIQKLTKELSVTRTYLQSKEEEVVMMRREKIEAQKQMSQDQADKLVQENEELKARFKQLEQEVQQAEEGQKTLMLQRKTLISNKESVQKELDKVLKRTETQLAEKEKQLKDRTMAFEAMKMEADATIQELRDQNTQQAQMSERLFTARQILEKEREELTAELNKKVQESRRIEESLREQLLHRGKQVKDSGFDGLLRAFDLYEEGPKRASKETQTDAVKFLNAPTQ